MWLALGIVLFGQTTPEARQTLPVRHPEGLVHGFLALKTLDGKALADGDLIQNVRGDRVTSRLLFRFRDGSTHDETVVYAQQPNFRLISDRLIQKGPAFPRAIDMSIDGGSGRVVVKYTDDGAQKTERTAWSCHPIWSTGSSAHF